MKKIHLLGPKGVIFSSLGNEEILEAANSYLSKNNDVTIMNLYVADDNKFNFIPFYQWLAEEAPNEI